MNKSIYILVLLLTGINSYAKKNVFVLLDDTSLYQFTTKCNADSDRYLANLKVLMDEFKKEGFKKKNKPSKSGNEIVIVDDAPGETEYYEFRSHKKPNKTSIIDTLKTYKIKDVSKNTAAINAVWENRSYSIIFIEKKNNEYILWNMDPVHEE